MTLVIAHRGDTRAGAENSLAAIVAAATSGADAVEVDVRLTADSVPVLHHDLTLLRTHGVPVGVRCLSFGRLRRIAPHVPTLAEALEALRPSGVPLLLDLRSRAAAQAAVDVVRAQSRCSERRGSRPGSTGVPVDSAVWFCGRPGPLTAVRQRDPVAALLLSWRCPVAPPAALVAGLAPSLFNPWHGLVTRGLVDHWQRRGIGVGAWTVDDAARRAALRGFGVEALITNALGDALAEQTHQAPSRLFDQLPAHLPARLPGRLVA